MATLLPLDAFPDLRSLIVYGTVSRKGFGPTDEGMKRIGRLTKLEFLAIWYGSDISDVGTGKLKSLRNLKSLHLDSDSRITDESLKTFSQLPRLERMSLEGEFSDAGLFYLRNMKQLKSLTLNWKQSRITDAGIAHLKNLKNLTHFDLMNSGITDDSLKTLSRLPHLEELSLQGNHLTDKGLAHLRGMTQLKTLSIGQVDNEISNQGMRHLKGLTNLEDLNLQLTRVTVEGLEQLTGLKRLKRLVLGRHVGNLAKVKQALPKCKIEQDVF